MPSVVLLGLGNVAVGYDLPDKSSTRVLSHAGAFSQHPSFDLIGGVDPNIDCRLRFEAAYSVPAYAEVTQAMRELMPEVVVVATPTPLHLDTVQRVFAAGQPKVILCEKPLSSELHQARDILSNCTRNDCALYLNFFRRAEPGVAEIRARLRDGRIEKPVKGVVWYSKGLMNSGVHFLDLLQTLLGEVIATRVLASGRLWRGIDPEPDVEITFEAGRVIFLAAKEEKFFHNTFELIAPNGRLRYELGGAHIVWQGVHQDSRFPGYVCLEDHFDILPADFDRIQWHVVDQLAAAINGQPFQLCTGAEALHTQEILQNIKEKI